MKKNSLQWLMVALACVAGAGCRKSNGNAAADSKVTGSPSDAPVLLVPKWTPGKRYVMRMESAQTMQLPNFMAGRGGKQGATNVPMENNFAQEYSLAVTNAADGNRGMEMEIIALELQVMQGDQQQINYDSRNKVARDGGPMTGAFDRLVGGKVYYLVSPENKVLKVEGIKQLFDRVEGAANDPAGATPPRAPNRGAAGLLRGIYNEEVFKQMIEVSSAPPQAVRVGENWTVNREMSQPMIGKLNMSMTNTFRGWQEHDGQKCARVEFTGTITSGGEGGTAPGMPFRLALRDGGISGRYWLASELGIAVETSVDQNYTMAFDGMPQAGGNERATVSFSAPVRQNVLVKLLEVKTVSD